MKITSVNNEKVTSWAKLKMKKYRDVENIFLVEGENLVQEALNKGIVKEIITTQEIDEIQGIPTYIVNERVMQKISNLMSAPKIVAVCKYILPDDIKGNVLILDQLQDPGNLGTIIRSAVAFGFETIICSSDTVDFYNSKVIRSSEGMIFHVNLIKDDLVSIIDILKNNDYMVIGTDVNSGKSVKNFAYQKCAYVIGNEGSGISLLVKELCDDFVNIPMKESCESLNASVAASIIMYEVYRG